MGDQMMPPMLAFDIYGTLIDTRAVITQLAQWLPNEAAQFVTLWREKQLEYSFRRGLMRSPCDFAVPTRDALDYCCDQLGCDLTETQRAQLMAHYARLPAFADAATGLAEAKARGFRLCAFSNGSQKTVTHLLRQAGLLPYFEQVVSVEVVGSFKPHPQVYQHVLTTMQVQAQDSWLISGNAFDVIGADQQGFHTAWIQRNPQQAFDVWRTDTGPVQPSLVRPGLEALAAHIGHYLDQQQP